MSSLIGIAMISSPERKDIKGVWRINTVLVDEDTLFRADSARYTARFYEKNIYVEDKSEAYNNYLTNCIKGTYSNLTRAKLTINRRKYSQSLIMPCWDHIKHPAVDKGKYSLEEDTLRLSDSEMNLRYVKDQNTLVYTNHEYNYEITYRKLD
jgi:hypothetical protein